MTTTMTRPTGLLLAIAAVTTAGPGCVISATGELPDVEVIEHDVALPPAPRAGAAEVGVSVPFKGKSARLGLPADSFEDVRIIGVSFTAKSGVADLSFVRAARITVASTDAIATGLQPVEVARYDRDEGTGVEALPSLILAADPPADVTAFWRQAQIVFNLEVAGDMPVSPWSVDVAFRFSALLRY
jgi:hypothetical protein